MTNANERFACARCGLSDECTGFTHLANCPSYGSSDCPITMGYEEGAECETCESDEWYEELRDILGYR